MDDHDRRQLGLMSDQIAAYRAGTIDLNALILSLEALLGAVSSVPEAWVDAFLAQWGELEQTYSVAVVRGEPVDGPSIRQELASDLGELERLISAALEADGSSDDDIRPL